MEKEIKGYNLDHGDVYEEIITREDLYNKFNEILPIMMQTLKEKTEHYNNAISKSSFKALFWDLNRKFKRIKLALEDPTIRKMDIMLGRDSEIQITNEDSLRRFIDEDYKGKVNSMKDTLIDNAIYSIIGMIQIQAAYDKIKVKIEDCKNNQFKVVD